MSNDQVQQGAIQEDACVHAFLEGERSLCGMGLLIARLPGPFDPTFWRACLQCAKKVKARSAAEV